MNEGEALYRQILAEPKADDLRLIYADWLEDDGQPDRAEFVRVQVELARTPEPAELSFLWPDVSPRVCAACHAAGTDCRFHALRRRERQLWDLGDWMLVGLPAIGTPARWNHGIYCAASTKNPDEYVVLHRRGFIDEIRAPLDALEEHLPAVVEMHPVTRAVATDKEPARPPRGLWGWYALAADDSKTNAADELPTGLFLALDAMVADCTAGKAYPSGQAAFDALSEALLRRARPGVKP